MELELPEKYMKPIPSLKIVETEKTKLTSKDISRFINLSGEIRKWKKKSQSPKFMYFFKIIIQLHFLIFKRASDSKYNQMLYSDIRTIANFKLKSPNNNSL